MVPEAAHLVVDFNPDFLKEFLRRRIKIAGEHEILPNHEAEFVAEIVEMVKLVASAAPDADHVHVGCGGGVEQFLCQFRRGGGRERVGRNPVGALAEDFAAVDPEGKARASLIRRGDELNLAEPDASGFDLISALNDKFVERLFARSGRPPQFRIGHMEGLHVPLHSHMSIFCRGPGLTV